MTFRLLGYEVWSLVYKGLPQGMRCGPEVRGFGPGHEDFPLGDEDRYEVWPGYEVGLYGTRFWSRAHRFWTTVARFRSLVFANVKGTQFCCTWACSFETRVRIFWSMVCSFVSGVRSLLGKTSSDMNQLIFWCKKMTGMTWHTFFQKKLAGIDQHVLFFGKAHRYEPALFCEKLT